MSAVPDEMKQRVLAIVRRFKQEHYLPLIALAGVTPSETHAIIAIDMGRKAGIQPVQPHVIAKGLHQTPSAVSQTLKGLEEKGYLRRGRVSDDSRAVSLELTDSGRLLVQEANRMLEGQLADLLDYLGREDAEHLLDTLEKILDFQRIQAQAGKMEQVGLGCAGQGILDAPPYEGQGPRQPLDYEGSPCT